MLINSLGLKNFKCFEELDVKFAPITLLTGANSSGKSSLINAILAVLQTEQFPFYLSPNGKYVNMGSFEEMVYLGNKNLDITINLNIDELQDFTNLPDQVINVYETNWIYNSKNTLPELQNLYCSSDDYLIDVKHNDLYYEFNANLKGHYWSNNIEKASRYINAEFEKTYDENKITISKGVINSIQELSETISSFTDHRFNDFYLELTYHDSHFNYIGSFRNPPERTYNQKAKAVDKVTSSGEGYIDQLIEWEETDAVEFKITNRLLKELGLLNDINFTRMRGGRFEFGVKPLNSERIVSLTDVGFGISQFLPIIVADLQLSNESCLAVSQPEIHLHPKVQAQFGNYLVNQIKHTQKQYIIETHSEYLINRIRLLLVTGELKPEDVCVLYFENDGIKSTVHPIEFTTKGAVKGAPQGFFDTYEMDVMDIAMHAIG